MKLYLTILSTLVFLGICSYAIAGTAFTDLSKTVKVLDLDAEKRKSDQQQDKAKRDAGASVRAMSTTITRMRP